MATDPPLRALYPEDDLGPAEERFRMFLEQYWGGPTTYSDQRGHPRLRMRHHPFKVTPLQRDRWLHHIMAAVDTLDLPPANDLLLRDYLERAAHSMVNSLDEAEPHPCPASWRRAAPRPRDAQGRVFPERVRCVSIVDRDDDPLPRLIHPAASADAAWWRHAVIYQIYPRSWADADGDGIGDLPGVTARLDYLKALGVDAVWFSPFYKSPQADAGYDVADYRDIDRLFGTLADADAMVARAHELGLKVIVDLVPNHTSDEHEWFQAALAAAPGSPERDRYIFRDGKGPDGELPPNDWHSVFGGDGWTRITEADGTPGQWYLHLFDTKQPDLNWDNPEIGDEFESILRFWLDRGIDGFRVDVAHGLIKEQGLPDYDVELHILDGELKPGAPDAARCGTRTPSTTSTAAGTRCWPSTASRTASSWPRPGCDRRSARCATSARTRCTRRSTSTSCRASGAPRTCAR